MADTGKIWFCKIGESRPDVANPDQIMRNAVRDAYRAVTDCEPRFIFSGWCGELTEPERAVVENRLPIPEATPPADAALADAIKLACNYYRQAGRVGTTSQTLAKQHEAAADKIIAEALRVRAVPEGDVIEKIEEYGGHRENEGGSYATFQKSEARRYRAEADEVLGEIRAMLAASKSGEGK